MVCKKCYVGYMLSHPEAKFARNWLKCPSCGYCHKVSDLKVVSAQKKPEPEQ